MFPHLHKALLLGFVLLLSAAGLNLSGCAQQPQQPEYRTTPVVTVQAPVRVEKVNIVPEIALQKCDPLEELNGGDARTVLTWGIRAHGDHGKCMFQKDLSDAFIRAAAGNGGKLEIYDPDAVVTPEPVALPPVPTSPSATETSARSLTSRPPDLPK